MALKKHRNSEEAGLALGFRSGLEEVIAEQIARQGLPVAFESVKIRYTKPVTPSKYTPDFILPNGIIVETKGRFQTADRQKHKLIKDQNPDLDLRFVFSNSRQKISKGSKTTYGMWCDKYGFKYADKYIPQEWLDEPVNEKRVAAIKVASA